MGIAGQAMTNGKGPVDPTITSGIAIVVTALWTISFVVNIISPAYDPPPAIHAAFMLIAGGIFGYQIIRGHDNK